MQLNAFIELIRTDDPDDAEAERATILPPHLDYPRRADEAVDFLVEKANQATAARKRKAKKA